MPRRVSQFLVILGRLSIVARLSIVSAIAATGAIVAAGAIVSGAPALARPAPAPAQTDAREALRRARLEQGLIQAEKTVVLLGELVAADPGERP